MIKIPFRGEQLPIIGFGTWCIGDNKAEEQNEIDCIKTAVNQYGMTLIDTAEMYGSGKSEAVVGKALKDIPREDVFIVDKILPENAVKGNFKKHVLKSLELTGCDYFDLYLLHWRAGVVHQDVVDEMEMLVSEGLIRHWGVSNFDVDDMEELFECRNGRNCFANQFLYNISARGVEYDLIDWCNEHEVLPMIYSPLGDTRRAQLEIAANENISDICIRNNISVTNLMLRFVIRNRNLITVFKTSSTAHLADNMKDYDIPLSTEDLNIIDEVFPKPTHKIELDTI